MLDPATARLCVRLPLEAAFRLFSKLGSLGGSIRERFSRTGRTRPALARPAFSRWLLENDRLRERWPCQWLNVLYFPFSETSPRTLRCSQCAKDRLWPVAEVARCPSGVVSCPRNTGTGVHLEWNLQIPPESPETGLQRVFFAPPLPDVPPSFKTPPRAV